MVKQTKYSQNDQINLMNHKLEIYNILYGFAA